MNSLDSNLVICLLEAIKKMVKEKESSEVVKEIEKYINKLQSR